MKKKEKKSYASGFMAHLPAFLIIRKVAVSWEASGAKLLPCVGVLVGLEKMLKREKK